MLLNLDFHHEKNYIDSDKIAILNDKFNDIQSKQLYKSVDNNRILLTPKETYSEPIFDDLCKNINKFFRNELGLTNLKLSHLWLVSTSSADVNSSKLPYIPHFDKLRFFKAMVYLHEVTSDNGPIYLGKAKNKEDIEQRRRRLPDDYKMKSLNTIKKHDIKKELTPLIGSAGDVIFFDTNTPHKAGILSDGFKRQVLRFDFELSGLNPKPSLINRILKKYF